jgi:transcriptional regulator with XRE-family HTH domain
MDKRKKTGNNDFAARVKSLREGLNLTQVKLAENSGISLALVREIEYGNRFGRPETHQKLATALNVSVSYLVYGTDPPESGSNPALNDFITWLASKNPSHVNLWKLKQIAKVLFENDGDDSEDYEAVIGDDSSSKFRPIAYHHQEEDGSSAVISAHVAETLFRLAAALRIDGNEQQELERFYLLFLALDEAKRKQTFDFLQFLAQQRINE